MTTDNPYIQKVEAEATLRRELYTAAVALSSRIAEAMGLSPVDLERVPDGFTWCPGDFTVTKNDQPWDSLRGTWIRNILTVSPILLEHRGGGGWQCIAVPTGPSPECWVPDEGTAIELLATLRNVRDSHMEVSNDDD